MRFRYIDFAALKKFRIFYAHSFYANNKTTLTYVRMEIERMTPHSCGWLVFWSNSIKRCARDGSFYDVAVRFVTFSVYGVRKELNAYQFAHSATSLVLTHLVFAHRGHEM